MHPIKQSITKPIRPGTAAKGFVAWAAAIFAITNPGIGACQSTVVAQSNNSRRQVATITEQEQIVVSWLNKPWSGDDTSFAAARKKVEQAGQDGSLSSLIDQYQAKYKLDPTNLSIQFTYLYGVWLNRWQLDVPYSDEEQQDIDEFSDSLWRYSHPNTYNYTRMASLCWNCWGVDESLFPFLERLIHEDQSDPAAQYLYPGMLAASHQQILRKAAISAANAFVAAHPDLNVANIVAGYAYYMQWLANKDPGASQKAIACFQRYLSSAQPDGYHRLLANAYISYLGKK